MAEKRVNSKAKGSSFELSVAKSLTEWTGKKFHRTPGSGALHWKNDARVVSDIVPPADYPEWKLSIECKCYKKDNYKCDFQSLLSGQSTMFTHWEQAVHDANREGLIPILITKVTGLLRPPFCVMRRVDADRLRLTDYFPKFNGQFPHIIVRKAFSDSPDITENDKEMTIFSFQDLLDTFTADEFTGMLNRGRGE